MTEVYETDYEIGKETIRTIRHRVFVIGQNVPEDIEADGKDKDCYHVLLSHNGSFAGTGRMEKNGHIGRIAVLEEFRGRGFGKMIVKKLENIAKKHDIKKTYLNSQLHAVSFYKNIGYEPEGDTFYEARIEHIKMGKYI